MHCPKPGTESDEQHRLGLIGCGSANVTEPDDEGLYDCLDCGLWSTEEEGKVSEHGNLQPR